ncbi:hypothetical protein ACPF7Z_12455 [Halomonas sp. GXIMD04776]|uniref:hypothetical protein n=1 Tax=Halomonas sp. GXIMD04776 TaxID=3415605 RepID=UPI003CA7BA18
MTTQRHSPQAPNSDARESFTEHVQGPGIVHQMALLEPVALNELISDLEAPLNPNFERAVEAILSQDTLPTFDAARTLLPAMLARFGLTEEDYDTRAETLAALRKACHGCPIKGRCWQVLRSHADAAACGAFCPSAETIAQDAVDLLE